jgi:hypothetical protein
MLHNARHGKIGIKMQYIKFLIRNISTISADFHAENFEKKI